MKTFKWLLFVLLLLPFLALANFSDTSNYDWQESIDYLRQEGIIEGYSDGSYQPNKKINRAEFLKIVMESAYGNISSSVADDCFTDVDRNDWFSAYVCLAKQEGIIQGYSDGSFRPGQLITQPEALKIIFEALQEEVQDKKGEWYNTYLDHADWIGMFYFQKNDAPRHQVTRGEMAYFMAWLFNENGSDQIDSVSFYNGETLNQSFDDSDLMTAEDCLPQEKYDPVEHICYYECDSDEECSQIEAQIQAQLDGIFQAGEGFQEIDDQAVQNIQTDGESLITTYIIDGNQIKNPQDQPVSESFKGFQSDKVKHQIIWDYFVQIIPDPYRKDFSEFQIFSDGKEGTMAAVSPTDQDPTKWILMIDIDDAFNGDVINKDELTYTLIHEFAHVLTLGAKQVDPFSIEGVNDMEALKVKCHPHHAVMEGCTFPKSYINLFFKTFWTKLMPEFNRIQQIEDSNEFQNQANAFYEKYQSHFVSDYAATNLGEDIAETFTVFVLKSKPAPSTIADQKVLFFYDYPELVQLKKVIGQRLVQ